MNQTFKTSHTFLNLAVLANLLLVNIASASTDDSCAYATPVELNDTYRGHLDERNISETFIIDIPVPGVAIIDVSTPGAATTEAKLSPIFDCNTDRSEMQNLMIERSVTHQAIGFMEAGRYLFRVGAQDPRAPLGDYRVTTSFGTANLEEEEVNPDPNLEEEEVNPDPNLEEEEVNPDPNFQENSPNPVGTRTKGQRVGFQTARFGGTTTNLEEEEVNPDPNLEEEEVNPDPNFQETLPNPTSAGSEYQSLTGHSAGITDTTARLEEEEVNPDPNFTTVCNPQEGDDHSDTLACGTRISATEEWTGELANDWSDDIDVFSFTLSDLQTVAIETVGDTDTLGVLFDQAGQRLMVSDGGGQGSNFKIVKSLGPGRYYLRVEGSASAEGAYGLILNTLEW